jgi:hypothetical protein
LPSDSVLVVQYFLFPTSSVALDLLLSIALTYPVIRVL